MSEWVDPMGDIARFADESKERYRAWNTVGDVCGHCGFGIERVAGLWVHLEARDGARHFAEPMPARVAAIGGSHKMDKIAETDGDQPLHSEATNMDNDSPGLCPFCMARGWNFASQSCTLCGEEADDN